MGVIKTTSQLAEIFAVTPKTIRAWIRDGMPVVTEGKQGAGNEAEADLEAAARWYFEINRERLALDRERTRLAAEQADKTALENAVNRGELGVVSEMAEFYGQHIDRAQRRLQQIPQALGQYCDEKTASVVVGAAARLIDECVRELAADEGTVQRTSAITVEAEAAANGKPVGRRAPKAKRRKQR